MRGLQTFGNLFEDGKGLVERYRPSRDPLCQRLTLDQLHDQKAGAVGLFQAVNRGDVGVVESCEKLRLPLKTREAFIDESKKEPRITLHIHETNRAGRGKERRAGAFSRRRREMILLSPLSDFLDQKTAFLVSVNCGKAFVSQGRVGRA